MELVAELCRRWDVPDDAVDDLLIEYARLTPELIQAVGGTDFPPLPMRRVA